MKVNAKVAGKIAGVLLFGVLFTWIFLLRAVTPGAGEEAVLIHKPIFFGKKGVDPVSVKTGREYVWWTTDSVIVNMQPQQYGIHFEDLMSSDGVPLDFDSVIRLRITDSVVLIKKFGSNWYNNNVKAEFMNRVRQSVRKHGMNETAIKSEAVDAIDNEVSKEMIQYISRIKLPVDFVDMTVGKANPPDAIKNQRIETANQQQRAVSEAQRKIAEDARKMAEESRAASDNAYRLAMQLSPDQFLKLENIKMLKEVCAGGKCTFIMGGSNVMPTLDVDKR